MARLDYVDAQGAPISLVLDRAQAIRIGRDDDCDIRLQQPGAAGLYARIVHRDGRYTLLDSRSPEGIRVNGEHVDERALIDGDLIEAGGLTVRFRTSFEDWMRGPAEWERPGRTDVRWQRLVAASNELACDLWRAAAPPSGGLVLSPAGVFGALCQLLLGARRATRAELQRVLHLPSTSRGLVTAWGYLASALQLGGTLSLTTRLFGPRREPLAGKVFELMELADDPDDVGGKVFLDPYDVPALLPVLGMVSDPSDLIDPPARDLDPLIHQGIAHGGRGSAPGPLWPGSLAMKDALLVVSAARLRARWRHPFDRGATREAPFAVDGQSWTPVPTMHLAAPLPRARAEGVTLVELPHQVGECDTSVVLAVPDELDGLPAVEQRLDASVLAGWVSALRRQQAQPVELALPRFGFREQPPLDLTAALRSLGLEEALDPELADLSGFGPPWPPDEVLYLGQVIHSAACQLDEEGVGPADGAPAIAAASDLAWPASEPLRVDRPFLFLVVARTTRAVLLLGRVSDPRR